MTRHISCKGLKLLVIVQASQSTRNGVLIEVWYKLLYSEILSTSNNEQLK